MIIKWVPVFFLLQSSAWRWSQFAASLLFTVLWIWLPNQVSGIGKHHRLSARQTIWIITTFLGQSQQILLPAMTTVCCVNQPTGEQPVLTLVYSSKILIKTLCPQRKISGSLWFKIPVSNGVRQHSAGSTLLLIYTLTLHLPTDNSLAHNNAACCNLNERKDKWLTCQFQSHHKIVHNVSFADSYGECLCKQVIH